MTNDFIYLHAFSKFPTSNFKGALDKYNPISLYNSSIENIKINQYQKFQLILPIRFHFMRSFINSTIPRVSHRPLYCVFIEIDFEKYKMLKIFTFLQN